MFLKVDNASYSFSQLIELTSWKAQQISKVVYKATLFHVEQTVTLHIVSFNVLAQMLFLLPAVAYTYFNAF